MRFREVPLRDAVIIEPDPASDGRGLFARLFDAEAFSAHGLPTIFVQTSTSHNRSRGTLRGMHFQADPFAESKLVRCTAGALFDVIVDIRRGSTSFGRWHGIELSAQNRLAMFVPAGFAHGFLTLTDDTEVFYQMTQAYVPEATRGFAWDDPTVGIAWPISPIVMSERDRTLPRLNAI